MSRPPKSPDKIIAELEQKKAALDAQLEEARARQKEIDDAENAKCDAVMARAIRDRMDTDSAFAGTVRRILDEGTKKKRDRALLEKRGLLPSSDGRNPGQPVDQDEDQGQRPQAAPAGGLREEQGEFRGAERPALMQG